MKLTIGKMLYYGVIAAIGVCIIDGVANGLVDTYYGCKKRADNYKNGTNPEEETAQEAEPTPEG